MRLEGPLLFERGSPMRAVLFGAALLVSGTFGAGASTADAQQYGGYPSNPYGDASGNYLTPGNGYAIQYGGNYVGNYSGYAGASNAASPYAAVCGAVAYLAATQGFAVAASSPYGFTCAYLGLLGGAPGYGPGAFAGAGYAGGYGAPAMYGLGSLSPYNAGSAYYGVSSSAYPGAYGNQSFATGSSGLLLCTGGQGGQAVLVAPGGTAGYASCTPYYQ
jgi:hypothetical protein